MNVYSELQKKTTLSSRKDQETETLADLVEPPNWAETTEHSPAKEKFVDRCAVMYILNG